MLSSPIGGIVMRHIYMLRRDINYIFGTFYWPLLDVIIWGFLGKWIQQSQIKGFSNYEAIALLGILLWQIIGRGCNVLIIAFVEELWTNNIINLFSLPVRITEWICGVIIFFGIMLLLIFIFCTAFILAFYDVSLWLLVSTFFIFCIPLIFSSIWVGFTCLQLVTFLGRRGCELCFVIAWFLLPFSGAYYPIEVLPAWAQSVSSWIPLSYIFEGMRHYLMHGGNPMPYLLKGTIMSIIYAAVAIIVFIYCFNLSKKKGLVRLVD